MMHSTWQIMKICPHCQNQIPDENDNIYCPICNHIADEEVLLRLRIEKRLRMLNEEQKIRGKKVREEPVKPQKRYNEEIRTVRASENNNPNLSEIISIIVVVFVIAAIFFF